MMLTIFEEAEIRGVKKGFKTGRAEGRVEGEARALLRVLATRFQKVPKRVSDRISRIHDTVVLESLTVTAVTCKSLKEFEEDLM